MINKKLFLNKDVLDPDCEFGSIRGGFGEAILDCDCFCVSADLAGSLKLNAFKEKFPERFFEVGVAEQNMVLFSAGLASKGTPVFACSFSVFSPGRNWEIIRTSVCYNDVPVKIVGGHAGVITGKDGATHQMLEDIAITRVLPNMVVEVPCDYCEAKKATVEICNNKKPSYLRLIRPETRLITTEKTPYTFGKAEVFYESEKPEILIIACGFMVGSALVAADILEKKYNIGSVVLNNHTIKPMDSKTIIKYAKKCKGKVVCCEDHQIMGGMGSAVSEILSMSYPSLIGFIGIDDKFGESGFAYELIDEYNISEKDILNKCLEILNFKK